MRADGSIVAVAPGVPATKPTWSPDGRSLAFVLEGAAQSSGGACNADGSPCGRTADSTYAVDADGSRLRLMAYGTNPAWFVPLPGQPAAAFTATCAERTCQFNATGSFDPDGAIVNYEWQFGDGTSGSGPAAAHTYSYAGGSTYTAILIVTDDDGQRDATRGRPFTLADAPPIASFTFACTGLTCAFDASASFDDGSISSYDWYFQDGAYGNGRTPSHQYLTGGTYGVALRVTDNSNRTSNLDPPSVGFGPAAAGHAPRRSRRCEHDDSEVVERERDYRGPHRESRQRRRRNGHWHVGRWFHCNMHDEWLRTLCGQPGRHTAQDVERQFHGDERDPSHFRVQPGQQSRCRGRQQRHDDRHPATVSLRAPAPGWLAERRGSRLRSVRDVGSVAIVRGPERRRADTRRVSATHAIARDRLPELSSLGTPQTSAACARPPGRPASGRCAGQGSELVGWTIPPSAHPQAAQL